MDLDTDGEYYQLNESFNAFPIADHCLNITVGNVTLDGAGYTMTGNSTGSG